MKIKLFLDFEYFVNNFGLCNTLMLSNETLI